MLNFARARNGLFTMFFSMGFASTANSTRMAEIKAQTGANETLFGYALTAATIGGFVGNTFAHRLVHKLGSRTTARIFGSLMIVCAASHGFVQSAWQLALAAFSTSLCYSTMNVAVNSQGVDIEHQLGKSTMPLFHAGWSAGALSTSLIGASIVLLLAPQQHLLIVGAFSLVLLWVGSHLILDVDLHDDDASQEHSPLTSESKKSINRIALAMSLALVTELAVFDWSSIFLNTELGIPLGLNAVAIPCFFIAQIFGRVIGGKLNDQFGVANVVRIGGTIAGLYYATVLLIIFTTTLEETLSQTGVIILICSAFAVLGLGVAAMPAAFLGAAGRVAGISTARGIAAVALRNSAILLVLRSILSTVIGESSIALGLFFTAITLVAAAQLGKVLQPSTAL